LSGTCTATKRNKERCTLPANGPQGLCWAHDPKNAEKRRRGASRGGRGKARPGRELENIKARLFDLADSVLAGLVRPGAAAVSGQLLNTVLRAVELERKIREAEELEERLAALENRLVSQGGSKWRA